MTAPNTPGQNPELPFSDYTPHPDPSEVTFDSATETGSAADFLIPNGDIARDPPARREPALTDEEQEILWDDADPTSGAATVSVVTRTSAGLYPDREPVTQAPATKRARIAVTDRDKVPPVQRLRAVHEAVGFYATTHLELNTAMTLVDYLDRPSGTAMQLNEILRHQQKSVSKDPPAALRSVAQLFAGYVHKARADKTALGHLNLEINASSAHRFTTLKSHTLYEGLGQLARYRELHFASVEGESIVGGLDPLEGNPADKRKEFDRFTIKEPDPEVQDRINLVTGVVRKWRAPHLIKAAIADQQNRQDFWAGQLRGARQQLAVRKVVDKLLIDLGYDPRG